jgi:hypothetical protein
MQKTVFDDERLRYLTSRVTEATRRSANLRELGDMALEVMMERLRVEEQLTHKPKKEERTRLKRMLRHLKDAERGIVRVYILQSLGRKSALNPFLNYMYKRDALWEAKP